MTTEDAVSGGAEPVRPVRYRELFLPHGDVKEPTLAVIRSPVGFERLWASTYGGSPPQRLVQPPAVDWGREAVVVAALGMRPTRSGYAVYLSMYQDERGLHVSVHESIVGPGDNHLQAVGFPTVVAAVVIDRHCDVAFHLQRPVVDYEPTPEQQAARRRALEVWQQAQETDRA